MERIKVSTNIIQKYRGNLLIFLTILIGLFAIFSYGINSVSAASGDTIYVNTNGNNSWNGLNSTWINGTNGPKATIKNATSVVNSGGTVYIANGTYKENNITINKNMTLVGYSQYSTIINGTNNNTIFNIVSGMNVTIIGLTLTNGNATWGGAIGNAGNLNITNSTFTNNFSVHGGAIDSTGNVTTSNSTFAYNTANNEGGAIYSTNSNLTITNSIFMNNTANDGGAINIRGNLTVNGSTFTKNIGITAGGAIEANNSYLNINNSTFTFNMESFVLGGGGAIYNYNCTITVNNTTFTNNTGYYGGAIWNVGNLIVNNSTFTNNTANIEGGAIENYNNANINFNRIIGNNASIGSAINNKGGTVNATLNWWGSNSNPSNNVSGGANVTSWLVLTVIPNLNVIPNNYNSTITADLLHDSNSIIHDPNDGQVPNWISVVFNSTLGTISQSFTINGRAQSVLNSGLKAGLATISATVDNQTVQTLVTVLDTISPTSNSSITSGIYNTSQNVSLNMSEPGTIYYTTDGTTPTYNNNRYLSPIVINKTTTLKFFAMDLAGNISPIYNNTYTINLPPINPVTVNSNLDNGTYTTIQNVSLTMNTPGTIYYTTDGTTPTYNSNRYQNPIKYKTPQHYNTTPQT